MDLSVLAAGIAVFMSDIVSGECINLCQVIIY